jgi:RHH-type transcriptional regulator, proline utilization regulon repressor / proline dehydrogenase / delta 1-pyrroline-5-carboxylate dehydrogenase
VLRAGNEMGACVNGRAVSGEGRLELLWYVREQSISTDYHRYGNLGVRAAETRAEVS